MNHKSNSTERIPRFRPGHLKHLPLVPVFGATEVARVIEIAQDGLLNLRLLVERGTTLLVVGSNKTLKRPTEEDKSSTSKSLTCESSHF